MSKISKFGKKTQGILGVNEIAIYIFLLKMLM
jgi:hypothetical protein